MSTTEETIKAAADTTANAIKLATALRAKLAAAPKPPSAELCKAAAEALVTNRWTSSQDIEKVAQLLADPATAVQTLHDVVKAASERLIELNSREGRLASGQPIPADGKQTKAASAVPASTWGRSEKAPESEADQKFFNSIMAAHDVSVR